METYGTANLITRAVRALQPKNAPWPTIGIPIGGLDRSEEEA